jgi:hypothetical protein
MWDERDLQKGTTNEVSTAEAKAIEKGLEFKKPPPGIQRANHLQRRHKSRADVIVSRKIVKSQRYLRDHGLPHAERIASLHLGSTRANEEILHSVMSFFDKATQHGR